MRVARFHALADPTRLRIVTVLTAGPRCVCDLQAQLAPIATNLLSYHLGVLRAAGLVRIRRRGRWIDYQLDLAAFEAIAASLPHAAGSGGPTATGPESVGDGRGQGCSLNGEGALAAQAASAGGKRPPRLRHRTARPG